MTDENLGEPIDRLAKFNKLYLKMTDEDCLDFSYSDFVGNISITNWNQTRDEWRQWIWQTCTEFGWYQTTNQVK